MNLFYSPNISGKTWTLPEDESKHVIKVLRLKLGDQIFLTDGKGSFYTTEILSEHPKKCELGILKVEKNFGKRDYFLQIAKAPTKNNSRFEWFLEKSTEIGIDVITPVICQRSERRQVKIDRLNRVITSAMKQSLKAYHPLLEQQQSFSSFIKSTAAERSRSHKFIAHCGSGPRESLKSLLRPGSNSIILIGPEGDFTDEEIELATQNNFIPVSLGNSRLRTETAGVVACHTVALGNEE